MMRGHGILTKGVVIDRSMRHLLRSRWPRLWRDQRLQLLAQAALAAAASTPTAAIQKRLDMPLLQAARVLVLLVPEVHLL